MFRWESWSDMSPWPWWMELPLPVTSKWEHSVCVEEKREKGGKRKHLTWPCIYHGFVTFPKLISFFLSLSLSQKMFLMLLLFSSPRPDITASLASTYLLSRITVVHHAALNCIRRIFAIVITSIIFTIPFTVLNVTGIIISCGGFMLYTYAKSNKTQQPNPLSSLFLLRWAYCFFVEGSEKKMKEKAGDGRAKFIFP